MKCDKARRKLSFPASLSFMEVLWRLRRLSFKPSLLSTLLE
jgi:hypothetical protein